MRTGKILIAIVAGVGSLAFGSKLDKEIVAEEAKWVAHIDLEALTESYLGQYFIDMGRAAMEEKKDMPIQLDFDVLLQDLKSVTAYGYEFQDNPEEKSVVIVKTGERLRAIVDAFLVNMEVSGTGSESMKAVADTPFPTYLLDDELYISMPTESMFIGSKSFDQIEQALSVIEGQRASIAQGESNLVRGETEGFFFFASANGLNELDGIPPQARMLQQATGAQFSLGEMQGDLRTRLLLTTENATVSGQLYRIIQGLLALVSFTQVENESLEQIVRKSKVDQGDDFVSVDLSYSSEDILKIVKPLIEKGAKPKGNLDGHHGKKERQNTVNVVVEDAIGGEELKVLNADASKDDGHLPRWSVDGDMGTHWGSRGREWIRFELESPSLLRELQIAWGRGDQRKYRYSVQTSETGTNWKTIIDRMSSGATTELESVNIPDTATKWIRLMCNGNTQTPTNAIQEIRFIGERDYAAPVAE